MLPARAGHNHSLAMPCVCGILHCMTKKRKRTYPKKNQCQQCGQPCVRTWCSQVCHAKTRRVRSATTCKNCNGDFLVVPSQIAQGYGVFCSNSCWRAYQKATTPEKEYFKWGKTRVHRIVAEQKLGRPLVKGEVVHHIDGNRHNNAPENLMVFPSNSEHMKLHSAWTPERAARQKTKLTESMVKSMRAEYALGGISYARIAKRMDLNLTTVKQAIRGVTWRHINDNN